MQLWSIGKKLYNLKEILDLTHRYLCAGMNECNILSETSSVGFQDDKTLCLHTKRFVSFHYDIMTASLWHYDSLMKNIQPVENIQPHGKWVRILHYLKKMTNWVMQTIGRPFTVLPALNNKYKRPLAAHVQPKDNYCSILSDFISLYRMLYSFECYGLKLFWTTLVRRRWSY